jgi:2-oxo-4-hydroxy-4-carboxy--5-ureidoimidazoline (OHCU) decarboxylase
MTSRVPADPMAGGVFREMFEGDWEASERDMLHWIEGGELASAVGDAEAGALRALLRDHPLVAKALYRSGWMRATSNAADAIAAMDELLQKGAP